MNKTLRVSTGVFLFALWILSIQSFAQRENNIWCFGSNAGVDFNSGSPVSFNGVALNTTEGSSSIADASGNLLFYTDGITVWNRNHAAMPNGTGLFGGISSSQSALIVQQPGSSTIFYIFTTAEAQGANGFCYSIVDMTLQAGDGDVTTKNVQLFTLSAEKVCGTRHSNGSDVWVVGHELGSDAFHAYLVTSAGLNLTPVISNTGDIHSNTIGGSEIGYMKISPDGNHLALAIRYQYEYQLFNFNPTTGAVWNPITIPSVGVCYGVEFSPDNTKLYLTDGQLSQFDITSNDSATINASKTFISNDVWALQLAPDNKIYCAVYVTNYLNVINNPNGAGVSCNYQANAVDLTPNSSTLGLPNYITQGVPVAPPVAIFQAPDTMVCPGSCITFDNLSVNATSYQWLFPGGTPANDTTTTPTVCYNTSGTYNVILTASNGSGINTVIDSNYITVFPSAVPPVILQTGDTLSVQQGFVAYQWYYGSDTIPGATNYFHVATLDGNYNLIVTDENGCSVGVGILNVVTSLTPALSKGEGVSVFPNPAHNNFSLTFSGTVQKTVSVDIINTLSQTVYSREVQAKSGENKIEIIVDNLAEGLYLLKFSEGEKVITTTIFIQK